VIVLQTSSLNDLLVSNLTYKATKPYIPSYTPLTTDATTYDSVLTVSTKFPPAIYFTRF